MKRRSLIWFAPGVCGLAVAGILFGQSFRQHGTTAEVERWNANLARMAMTPEQADRLVAEEPVARHDWPYLAQARHMAALGRARAIEHARDAHQSRWRTRALIAAAAGGVLLLLGFGFWRRPVRIRRPDATVERVAVASIATPDEGGDPERRLTVRLHGLDLHCRAAAGAAHDWDYVTAGMIVTAELWLARTGDLESPAASEPSLRQREGTSYELTGIVASADQPDSVVVGGRFPLRVDLGPPGASGHDVKPGTPIRVVGELRIAID